MTTPLRFRNGPFLLAALACCLGGEVSLANNPNLVVPRVRKSYVTLTATEITDFQDACIALKAVDPGGVDSTLLGWDDFVKEHAAFMMNAHGGPAFLAWHREFLLRFEDALRAVNSSQFANVTIPYWDWAVDGFPTSVVGGDGAAVTDIVTTGPFAYSTTNWNVVINPIAGPELKRNFSPPLPNKIFTPAQINALMALPIFDLAPWSSASANTSFRNVLEGFKGPGFHNAVHGAIGGNMGFVNSSVNDPVFWMHHANVDRLWCQWQDIYPTYLHHIPTSGAPMGQNTLDSMPPFGVTPCDATNMVAMNYEYDDCVGPCTYDPGHAYAGQTYSQVLMKAMI